MYKSARYFAVLIVLINLNACSPKDQGTTEGVLTDAQKNTLKKAHETEDVINNANNERLKKLDEIN